jgi:dCMP deaminase
MTRSPFDSTLAPTFIAARISDVSLEIDKGSSTESRMAKAAVAAAGSPNRVRQVGAVLLTRDGVEIAACNDFPKGVRNLPDRCVGEGRFVWMEHAERGAILEAARRGLATEGGVIATTFFPCIDCARAIVGAGIACVETPPPQFDDPVWGASFERSQAILEEGGIAMTLIDDAEA